MCVYPLLFSVSFESVVHFEYHKASKNGKGSNESHLKFQVFLGCFKVREFYEFKDV